MSPKSKKLARRLLRENRGTRSKTARSWRTIARDDYNNQVNNATLCRIALSDGEWIPKDEPTLIVLGLKHAPRSIHPQFKDLFDTPSHVLLWKLQNREVMR